MKKLVTVLIGLFIVMLSVGCSTQEGKAPKESYIVHSDSGQIMAEIDKGSVELVDKDENKKTFTFSVYECLPTGKWHTAKYQFIKDQDYFRYQIKGEDWEKVNYYADPTDPRIYVLAECSKIITNTYDKGGKKKEDVKTTSTSTSSNKSQTKMGWKMEKDGSVSVQNDDGKTVGSFRPETIEVTEIDPNTVEFSVQQKRVSQERYFRAYFKWREGDDFFIYRDADNHGQKVNMSSRHDSKVFIFAGLGGYISQ